MGAISNRLSTKCIVLDPLIEQKEEVLRILAQTLVDSGVLSDANALLQEILEREELAPTALGYGCAIPHAHSSTLTETHLAAARITPPLDFWNQEADNISLVFLMVGPKNSAGLHIKLLSKLARLLHDEDFRNSLLEAPTTEQFYEIIYKKDM